MLEVEKDSQYEEWGGLISHKWLTYRYNDAKSIT